MIIFTATEERRSIFGCHIVGFFLIGQQLFPYSQGCDVEIGGKESVSNKNLGVMVEDRCDIKV